MNETTYIYICHSDINENNIYAEFTTEEEAIDYAMRHADELTYVDKVEVALDDEGDVIEVFDSETIWVYDELTSNTENKFVTSNDEVECQSCGSVVDAKNCRRTDGGYYVCNHCIDEDFDSLVETLEENEDVVECKECFELFPKDDCIKLEVGYVCPHCHGATDTKTAVTTEPSVDDQPLTEVVDMTPVTPEDPVSRTLLNNPRYNSIRYKVFYGPYLVARAMKSLSIENKELQDTDVICVFDCSKRARSGLTPYTVLDLMTVAEFKEFLKRKRINYKRCNFDNEQRATGMLD